MDQSGKITQINCTIGRATGNIILIRVAEVGLKMRGTFWGNTTDRLDNRAGPRWGKSQRRLKNYSNYEVNEQ